MRGHEVVQALIVIDEAQPVCVMRLEIMGIRFESFVLRYEIPVFAEKHAVLAGLDHLPHESHRYRREAAAVESILRSIWSVAAQESSGSANLRSVARTALASAFARESSPTHRR